MTWTYNVADANGQDVSNQTSIYYYQHSTKSLAKRVRPAPLMRCGDSPQAFVASRCEREISPQNFAIRCEDARGVLYDWVGACNPDEICVQGKDVEPMFYDNSPPTRVAYCVSTGNFIRLAQNWLDRQAEQAAGAVQQQLPAGGQGFAVEAVVTGIDPTKAVTATQMQFRAQSVKELFGARSYITLPGGYNECQQCSGAGLSEIPAEAGAYAIDVILPTVGMEANLYMVSFAP
ncbi:hypothetical protein MMC20_000772 [Loxospora ochrophaea]|nr:hypothetical protein [Loxospora ochrophaea]